MWKEFYFSSDFDLLMLSLLILIAIGGIIGITLYIFSLREKKKQTKLMEETFKIRLLVSKLSFQLEQGESVMKTTQDLAALIGIKGKLPNTPNSDQAYAKQLKSLWDSLEGESAAIANAFKSANLSIAGQKALAETGNVRQQAEALQQNLAMASQNMEKTVQPDTQATTALGQQEQQAIADSSEEAPTSQEVGQVEVAEVVDDATSLIESNVVEAGAMSPAEDTTPSSASPEAEPPTQEHPAQSEVPAPSESFPEGEVTEAAGAMPASEEQQELPFTLEDLRKVIRSAICLAQSYHISNPGQNIAGVFEIREQDARALKNTLIAKQKQKILAEIKNGERALKFLQEEYPVA